MKQNVTFYDFQDAFNIRPDSFSYAGLRALYDYLIDLEEGCGMEIELDPIALCCDFSEYGSAMECIEDAGFDFQAPDRDEDEDEDDYSERVEAEALEFLQNETTVLTFFGGIIIQDF